MRRIALAGIRPTRAIAASPTPTKTFSPLAERLPKHTRPELRFLEMSGRQFPGHGAELANEEQHA